MTAYVLLIHIQKKIIKQHVLSENPHCEQNENVPILTASRKCWSLYHSSETVEISPE